MNRMNRMDRIPDTALQRIIKDKKVILVGGWDSDPEHNLIQKYDVVVRINNHWNRQKGRCDILYQNCAWDTVDWVDAFIYPHQQEYPLVVFDFHGGEYRRNMEFCQKKLIPYTYFRRETKDEEHWHHKLFHDMNKIQRSSPFMGTMAAYHLFEHEPELLGIIGMPLFNNVPREHWKRGVCSHNPRVNAIMLRRLKEKDSKRVLLSRETRIAIEVLIDGDVRDPLIEFKDDMDDNNDLRSREKIQRRTKKVNHYE